MNDQGRSRHPGCDEGSAKRSTGARRARCFPFVPQGFGSLAQHDKPGLQKAQLAPKAKSDDKPVAQHDKPGQRVVGNIHHWSLQTFWETKGIVRGGDKSGPYGLPGRPKA